MFPRNRSRPSPPSRRRLGVEVAGGVFGQRGDQRTTSGGVVGHETPHLRPDQPPRGLVLAQHQVVKAGEQRQGEDTGTGTQAVPGDPRLGICLGDLVQPGVHGADAHGEPDLLAPKIRAGPAQVRHGRHRPAPWQRRHGDDLIVPGDREAAAGRGTPDRRGGIAQGVIASRLLGRSPLTSSDRPPGTNPLASGSRLTGQSRLPGQRRRHHQQPRFRAEPAAIRAVAG